MSVFDSLVRYYDQLRRNNLTDFEDIRPAVYLTPEQMSNFMDDPRAAGTLLFPIEGPFRPLVFYGLRIFEGK